MAAVDPWDTWTKRARDVVLLILGVGVIVFELLSNEAVRWELIVVAATMLGLPSILGLQDRANGDKDE